MPPLPGTPATATELQAFSDWVAAGTPMGTCVNGGTNPFDAPAQCTSKTLSVVDDGELMAPGVACITCHNGSTPDGLEAPDFTLAGTAYAIAHEPDNCNAQVETGPAISTAIIEITDKNGVVLPLAVNSVGNFSRTSLLGAVALPYTAKIKYNGVERVMGTAQMSGDCHTCHTQAGAQMAPGRILLP